MCRLSRAVWPGNLSGKENLSDTGDRAVKGVEGQRQGGASRREVKPDGMRSGSKEWASQTSEPGREKSSRLRGGAGARGQADRALALKDLGGPGFGMDAS